MEPRSLKFIEESCGGKLRGGAGSARVHRVCTDSRQAQPGDLFVPLRGECFDGHEFIGEAFSRGATASLAERKRAGAAGWSEREALIVVEETRRALGRLAAIYRQDFTPTAVAVGGSNGKTTVKDLAAGVLRRRFRTSWSEASFNNDIGVPLTLLQLNRTHEAAVFEVGTNHPGELAPLVEMVQPRFGIVCSIGREHLEFFKDLAGVAREQSALAKVLPANGRLFVDGDSPEIERVIEGTRAGVIRVGRGAGNDWRAEDIRMDERGLEFRVRSPDPDFSGVYRVRLFGRHQAVNALFAIALGRELGLEREEIERGLLDVTPPKMRMQFWTAGGVRLLDDSYNANADSMRAALLTLREFPGSGRRVAVLGEMAELGAETGAAHAEVGRYAAELKIDRLFVVGEKARETARAAREGGMDGVEEFGDVESAGKALCGFVGEGDLVLLKGSRVAGLEAAGKMLRVNCEQRCEQE